MKAIPNQDEWLAARYVAATDLRERRRLLLDLIEMVPDARERRELVAEALAEKTHVELTMRSLKRVDTD